MSGVKWTYDQQNAIDARKGSVLVSAAAGSGKTAVLVKRIIERITDPSSPSDADRLLVVTFTRAAAAEMRERISAALDGLLKEFPFDNRLIRQKLLLQNAYICTLHSFCSDLVRQNCQLLNVSPNFRIADENELIIMRSDAANRVFDEMYEDEAYHTSFERLVEQVSSEKDDRILFNMVLNIHKFISSHPFPLKWLDDKLKMYNPDIPFCSSEWYKILSAYILSALEHCISLNKKALDLINGDDKLSAAYFSGYNSDFVLIDALYKLVNEKEWDKAAQFAQNLSFERLKTLRGYNDEETKDIVKKLRDDYKKILSGLCGCFCASTAEHKEDITKLSPVIGALFEAVKRFDKRFYERKSEVGALDFSDLEHLTAELLIAPKENGGFKKTALAEEIAKRFDEILVDEYQDTNAIQDMIYRALSQNEQNIFTVGDVKQSIYGFRQAMPEIFLNRFDSLAPYSPKEDNYPARITLGKNFRSRREVADTVNFVFGQIMTKSTGGFDYDTNHALEPAAVYPPGINTESELHIISGGKKFDVDQTEGAYIAKIIKEMMADGFTVTQKDGTQREAGYGDFCILLRSTKRHARPLAEALNLAGVPASADIKDGFFSAYEVSLIISLLRIIDNPVQDIPLVSVLLSPLCGFTPDDLTEIRLFDRKLSFYSALNVYAQSTNSQKAVEFLENLKKLRRLSAILPSDKLISEIYQTTDILTAVSAMKNGRVRVANLRLFLDYAVTYESSGYRGLSGFIGFIDRLTEEKGDFSSADIIEDSSDTVRIMSIHQSKGLEFPVCIIAGCGTKFNRQDANGAVILHSSLGVGMKIKSDNGLTCYDTLPRRALSVNCIKESVAEEIRVLYVAMTRAKERLIMVSTFEDAEKELLKYSSFSEVTPYSVQTAPNMAGWLIPCFLRHPDCGELRKLSGAANITLLPCNSRIKAVLGDAVDSDISESNKEASAPCEEEILTQYSGIIKQLSFEYPFKNAVNVPSKVTASELSEKSSGNTHIFSRPQFTYKEGMTPAEKGSAVHHFMQYANYENAEICLEDELKRLKEKDFLTDDEFWVIDRRKISAFFNGKIYQRIKKSPNVLREVRLTTELIRDGEEVLLQSMADLIFEETEGLCILDYKTDRVSDINALAERYRVQLELYRSAAEKCFEKPVKQCILYSFYLDKWIEIE